MKKIPPVKELYKKYSKNSLNKNSSFFDESWFSRLIGRRISIYFTWIFLHIGITPNQASFIALATGLVGAALIAVPKMSYLMAGSLIFLLYLILDSSDGEIARITDNKSKIGAYFDNLLHIFLYAALFTSIGINIYLRTNDTFYLLLGTLAALLFSLASLVHYLDPIREELSYAEMRKDEGKILRYGTNLYNLLTGDIEIAIFLLIFGGLQYLEVISVDFFKLILVINSTLLFAGGIVFNLLSKFRRKSNS